MYKTVFDSHILCLNLSQDVINSIKLELNNNIRDNPIIVKPRETKNSYTAILENTIISHDNKYSDKLTLSELHKPVNAKSSNISCFWDSKPFNNAPICLPISYCSKTKTYKTIGCFCSTACAAAFNLSDTRYRYSIRLNRHNLLLKMHQSISDKKLKLAPPRERLKFFGGDLSITEFRDSNCLNKRVLMPPYRPYTIFHTDENIPIYNNVEENNDIKWTLLLSKTEEEIDKNKNKGLSKFIDVN